MAARRLAALIAGATLSVSSLGAAAQGTSACSCDDVEDLQARYCSVRGVIGEWDRLINVTWIREQRSGSPEMMTPSSKNEVAECADEVVAINRQEFTGTRSTKPIPVRMGGGDTDESCKVTVKAPTKCLAETIEAHEAWHKQTCELKTNPNADWKGDEKLGFLRSFLAENVNWRFSQSMMDYMNEERAGYTIEMEQITRRLTDLSSRCRTKFEFARKDGRVFSLTPCPSPNLSNYARKCKRLTP